MKKQPHRKTNRGDVLRTCLVCSQAFPSEGKGNRRCAECHHRLYCNANRLGYEHQERMDGDYVYN